MSKTFENIGNDALMEEVCRRGLLTELHGAVGAFYDHLANNGIFDGGSNTTSYLAYRLRREDAKLGNSNGSPESANYWQERIQAIDAETHRATTSTPKG